MIQYLTTRKDNFNNGKMNLKTEEDVASTITRSSSNLDISDNLIVTKRRVRLVDENSDLSPCILSNQAKQSTDSVYLIQDKTEPFCVAMRGRDPLNKNNRKPGVKMEQTLEPNSQGTTNTLTSVSKDNLIIEPKSELNGRLRRLTPLECFRLQGFPDEFIKPCSDNQLYKQAGNSITVSVMQAIIKNLLPIIN